VYIFLYVCRIPATRETILFIASIVLATKSASVCPRLTLFWVEFKATYNFACKHEAGVKGGALKARATFSANISNLLVPQRHSNIAALDINALQEKGVGCFGAERPG
jgi:hypothetical protein